MRVVRYRTQTGPRLGVLDGEEVLALPDDVALGRAEAVPANVDIHDEPSQRADQLEILAPVIPTKIMRSG